jgi:hypothetical protein
MPPFDESEFKALVASSGVGAVSVDTSVIDAYGRNLTSQPLLGLRQFHHSGRTFVLSDMVVGEVERHQRTEAADAQLGLHTAVRRIQRHWHRHTDVAAVEAALGIECTPAEFATRYLDDYVKATGAVIIGADDRITHAEVRRRYFDSARPFSTKKAKKDEFPDALALLSLEHWARQNNTKMLVISQDGDWKAFCEQSQWLICIDKLDVALGFFNRDPGFVVAKAIAMLFEEKAPKFREMVEKAVWGFLENFEPEIEASAAADYEVDVIEPILHSWELHRFTPPTIIESDDDAVVFSAKVDVEAAFQATFRFEVWDGVDRDHVSLGLGTGLVEQTITVDLIITISRPVEPEPEVLRISVPPAYVVLDFGKIGPDP